MIASEEVAMEREARRRRAEALDRFWNDIVSDGAAQPPEEVDEVFAAMIHRLAELGELPGMSTARPRVWQNLTRLAATRGEPNVSANGFVRGPLASDSTAWVPRQPAEPQASLATWQGFRRAGVLLATACLLLLTVGLGYLALRSGAPDQRLASLPALVAPATPAIDDQSSQTLAAITLPAGTVTSPIRGGLNHYTIPAGTQSGTGSTWVSTCCRGPRLEYVISGSFTVSSTGPVQVLRGGTGTWETIAADTELSITAGDALLLRLEDAFDAANTSPVPVELIEAVLIDTEVRDDPIPAGWVVNDQDVASTSVIVPPVPATLRLQRATVASNSDLLLPPDAIVQYAVSLDQAILGHRTDFAVQNISPQPVELYVLTLEPTSATTASPAARSEAPTGLETGTPSH